MTDDTFMMTLIQFINIYPFIKGCLKNEINYNAIQFNLNKYI